ncbi:MAG: hypothetical protein WC943_00655 [Elusimicrobiota bacterium]|jgi:hypothetical protein
MRAAPALLLLLGALSLLGFGLASAQNDLDLSEHDLLIQRMERSLREDPSTVDALADRISRSSLAGLLTTAPNQDRRLEEIKEWIGAHRDQAAQIAVGLARDDAEDNDAFESALKTSLQRSKSAFKLSSELDKTILGKLKESSGATRAAKTDELLKDEEKGELVKTLFEGDGSMTGKVLGFGDSKDSAPPAASVMAGSGFFDNLSAVNMGGYSPQLLAIQSSLNAARVPGAPRLVETGRLDYETLHYPSYQMRFDFQNLSARLRRDRTLALARLLGRERSLSPEDLRDPKLALTLEQEAGARLPPDARSAKRAKLLDRIRGLLADFSAAAAVSRDPSKITRGLLQSLGSRQKEAGRWITIASLEEELALIAAEEGFLSQGLLAAIDACPVPEDAKAAYKRRGQDYAQRLAALKANDEAAIAGLEAPGWEAGVAKVQALLSKNAGLRKNLSRDIRDYTVVPSRLAATLRVVPRWRSILEGLVLRFFPSSGYALGLRKEEREAGRLRDVFLKIAAGDRDAAHEILTAGF